MLIQSSKPCLNKGGKKKQRPDFLEQFIYLWQKFKKFYILGVSFINFLNMVFRYMKATNYMCKIPHFIRAI